MIKAAQRSNVSHYLLLLLIWLWSNFTVTGFQHDTMHFTGYVDRGDVRLGQPGAQPARCSVSISSNWRSCSGSAPRHVGLGILKCTSLAIPISSCLQLLSYLPFLVLRYLSWGAETRTAQTTPDIGTPWFYVAAVLNLHRVKSFQDFLRWPYSTVMRL